MKSRALVLSAVLAGAAGIVAATATSAQAAVRRPHHALGRRAPARLQPDAEAGRDHPGQRWRLLHRQHQPQRRHLL